MGNVAIEVEILARALHRRIEEASASTTSVFSVHVRVIQICPICEAVLGNLLLDDQSAQAIRRSLFAQYDEHRCIVSTDAYTKFERAERALVTAMDRISAIADPVLRARAEHEADRMATIAEMLRKQI
jgi:hypothetical protein